METVSNASITEASLPDTTELAKLVHTVALLRGPGGCPWDGEQTHESLVRYLIEECYELVEAIEAGSRDDLIEELGDVLYQVLFHADIAAHTAGEEFDLGEVARRMREKMVARHPHVFGDREAETADDVMAFWDELKTAEKPERTSVLDGIPTAMPALLLADKILGRADRVDVQSPQSTTVPVALDIADEDELGDTLLALVVASRERGLDAERALRNSLRRLSARIREAEKAVGEPGE